MLRAWLSMLALALVALAGATMGSASPESPALDFCGPNATTSSEITTDPIAGVTYASSIFVSSAGSFFTVGVYFNNDGPGPITFSVDYPAGAWSTGKGGVVPLGEFTPVPTTPGGSVLFTDGGWSGTFPAGLDFIGCVGFLLPQSGMPKATAHLNLSFTRDGVPHTVRVNVHFR